MSAGLHPGASSEFNYLSILKRVKNTLGPRAIFICCDENNLGIAKEVVKTEVRQRFDMLSFFKSDFVPGGKLAGMNNLDKSLLDYEIACSAECFIGVSSSSFSSMISFERHVDRSNETTLDYIYDVPGFHVAHRTDRGTFDRAELAASPYFETRRLNFYLANTYSMIWGDKSRRLKLFQSRMELADLFSDEYFLSAYRAAGLLSETGAPADSVISAYQHAIEAAPHRAEAIHALSCYFRLIRRHEEGFALAARGITLPRPERGLDIEDWIYDYGMLDEYAVHAYWTSRYSECLTACASLLGRSSLPSEYRGRIAENGRLALERLKEGK